MTAPDHLVDRLLGLGIPRDLPLQRAIVDAALALDGMHHSGDSLPGALYVSHWDDSPEGQLRPFLYVRASDLLSTLLREVCEVAHAWDDRIDQEHEDDPVPCKAGPDDRCASCDDVLRSRLWSALTAIIALLPPAAVIRLRERLAGAA